MPRLFKILVAIIVVLVISLSIFFFYQEYVFSSTIPLVFSEISQIKREQGTNLGAITEYYSMVNDA